MSVRHGFSEVPKWRSRGLLGIALTGALLAELFVATGEALAAPATTPTQEEPTRGFDGLEAPDAASAMTIARLQGERVEVVGARTATSSTWALPDGSFSTGLATGPIWVRQGEGDGTSSADWAPVDLTLEVGEDGTVRPKAHPAELVLAGEGTPEDGLLLSMQRAGGESVGLEWDGPLPAPRLEGPRAVYAEVQPGVDLVVEATRTGYEQFFVLTDRPAAGSCPSSRCGRGPPSSPPVRPRTVGWCSPTQPGRWPEPRGRRWCGTPAWTSSGCTRSRSRGPPRVSWTR